MRAAALALMLASAARAEPDGGVDTPLAFHFAAGVVLPDEVVCMAPTRAVAAAKRIVSCEAERDVLRESVIPIWVPIVVGVVAIGVGAGAGFAVAKSTK